MSSPPPLFARNVLVDICVHAVEEYPNECCGAVIQTRNGQEVRRITNIQARLHEAMPETYSRDARTAYHMEPRELLALERELATGVVLDAFYHSHPDHDAYFSDEDTRNALIGGEPLYPSVVFIVVSVYDGVVKEAKTFQWDSAKRSFGIARNESVS